MSKRRLGLSRKILSAVLLTSSVATLVTSAVQFFIEYKDENAALDEELKNFEKTSLINITKFAWDMDKKALEDGVSSLLAIHEMTNIAVFDTDNKLMARAQKPDTERFAIKIREFSLISPTGEIFGTLRLHYTGDFILQRIKLQAWRIIWTNFIKSIIVSLLLLGYFQRKIVGPIIDIAQHFTNSEPNAGDSRQPLILRRKQSFPDEFDDVVLGINAFQTKLNQILAEKAALIDQQDFLVQTRTNSLMAKSDQLAAAVEAFPGYVVWFDQNGNMVGANHLWMDNQVDDHTTSDLPKTFFQTGMNDFELGEHVRTLRLGNDNSIQYKTAMKNEYGTQHFLVCLSRLKSTDGIMVVAIDTTHAWELEQEANVSRAISANAARLSSLGEMAGGIAHEIVNPLTIILGKARMLIAGLAAESPNIPATATHAAKILDMAERISKIVSGMKTLSRNGDHDPMAIEPINQVVEAALEISKGRFKAAGVEFRWTPPNHNIAINCRTVQIAQVLINLLNNAADAVKDLEAPWAELTIREDDEKILIAVTDSGMGIPKDIRDKMLQPFFTTKPTGSGTGLGLSIALGIAREHGGSLHYDEACPNTRFIITLPKPILQASLLEVA